jgi:uncharacterized protein (TIGR03435 family)
MIRTLAQNLASARPNFKGALMRVMLFFALSAIALAQTPDSQVVFEVASIKAAPPSNGQRMFFGAKGGPGTQDPGRWSAENYTLLDLLTQAYDVNRYQVTGPDWLGSERFNITAKIPGGATKEQFRLMLQNLLIERFKLAVHRDKKETQVYELVVAKNGPKLKEAEPQPADAPPPGRGPGGPPRITFNSDGSPQFPPGRGSMMIMSGRGARMRQSNESMADFAKMLQNQLGHPVTDATGLKGKYDFELAWSPGAGGMMGRGMMLPAPPPPPGGGAAPPGDAPAMEDSGPTLMSAIQDQLGLKLEPKKGSVEMIVIDHIEKIPTEN